MSTRPYVIRQGDYLTQLAHRMGFDADAVWNDEGNRELRDRRPDRDVLRPGDVLQVPAAAPPGLDLSPHTSNSFKATIPRVEVRLTLRDVEGHAYASEPFCVHGPPQPVHGTTDGDGCAVLSVPINLPEVQLVLERPGRVFRVRVGHLDPIGELSGVRQRLAHLDHLVPLTMETDDEDVRLRRAVESFQRARGLDVTGDLDDSTRQALHDAHGS